MEAEAKATLCSPINHRDPVCSFLLCQAAAPRLLVSVDQHRKSKKNGMSRLFFFILSCSCHVVVAR